MKPVITVKDIDFASLPTVKCRGCSATITATAKNTKTTHFPSIVAVTCTCKQTNQLRVVAKPVLEAQPAAEASVEPVASTESETAEVPSKS
jgi:hypothetical protein